MKNSTWRRVGKTTAVILAAIVLYCTILFLFGRQLEKNVNAISHYTVSEDTLSAEVIRSDGTEEHYSGVSFPELRNGDRLVLTIDPQNKALDVPDPALTFALYHCRVKVYSGEELIYEQKDPSENQQIGHRYYIIPLPNDYRNKTIRIEAMDCENSSVSGHVVLQIVTASSAVYSFLRGRITLLLIMITVLLFSMFLFLLSGVKWIADIAERRLERKQEKNTKEKKLPKSLFPGGESVTGVGLNQKVRSRGLFFMLLLSFVLLFWYLAESGLLVFLTASTEFLANIEYTALSFVPVPLWAFLGGEVTEHKKRVTCDAISGLSLVFFLVTTYCNFWIPGVNYVDFITPLRMLLLISAGAFAVYLARSHKALKEERKKSDVRRKNRPSRDYYETGDHLVVEHSLLQIGYELSALAGAMECIRFELSERLGYRFAFLNNSMTPVVILLLTLPSLFYYGFQYTRESYERIEQESLRRIAYIDSLTGAPNRSACEREFEEIRNGHVTDYVCIFADINFLKRTNDIWGHDKGDELIRAAAEILSNHFGGVDFFGRWGGDEFIAIHYGTMKEAKERMQAVGEEIRKVNEEKRFDFTMSESWGFAESTADHPLTPEEAVNLADERMYEQKKRMHAERVD
ncbi:MAG: GGDEF domain-containing protein [Lachnospiraceae bacterium]